MTDGKSRARNALALGFGANVLFWSALFGFAALRPDYSHLSDAVSELGAWGAPNMWDFNVLGFIAPGVMVALLGWILARAAAPRNWLLLLLLCLAGAAVALAGLSPADLANFGSLTTTGHIIGSMGSGLAWLLAMPIMAWSARKTWPALALLSLTALAAMIGVMLLYGSPVPRALVQRLSFGIFFGYFAIASILFAKRVNAAAPPLRD